MKVKRSSKNRIRSCFYLTPKWIFTLCFLVMIGFNIKGLKKEINRIQMYSKVISHQKIGHQFTSLKQFIKDVEYIGYYSDEDFSKDKPVKTFAQAQYVLAPTILEHNNFNHEYILFVCKDERLAWKKMVEIGASPLRRSKFGMILAKKNP